MKTLKSHIIPKRLFTDLIIVIMALIIMKVQIINHNFINGADTFFHMSVVADAADQIKMGHFSYFLSFFDFYHSARIVNAIYGPLGGYLGGLLLLIVHNWINWQITISLIVVITAGIAMNQLCRYWHVKFLIRILISFLYMNSGMVTEIIFGDQFDSIGAAFMPWILMFGSQILNNDRIKPWQLVLVIIILAETHLFSVLLALTVLVICVIISIIYNHNYQIIAKMGKVVGLSLLLTFNVWGSILEVLVSSHHRIFPTYSVPNLTQGQNSSITYDPKLPISQNLRLLGISVTIIIIMTLVLYLINLKRYRFQFHIITIIFGLGYLWLSTNWFPWLSLQHEFPILDTDLQFPKRFLPVSISAIYLILGVLISRYYSSRFAYGIMIIILLPFTFQINHVNNQTSQSFVQTYRNNRMIYSSGDKPMQKRINITQLHDSLTGPHYDNYFKLISKATPDYLPSNQKITTDQKYHHLNGYNQFNNQVIKNHVKLRKIRVKDSRMNAHFNVHGHHQTILPVVKYPHTTIWLNHHKLSHYQLSDIGALTIKPQHHHNTISVKYHPSKLYKLGLIISILTWLTLIIIWLKHRWLSAQFFFSDKR